MWVRIIKYIYTVDGKAHTGEIYSKTGFVEGGTALVTYAKSDPSASTLQPEKTQSIYRTSLIVCAVALLPMLIMWFFEPPTASARNPPKLAVRSAPSPHTFHG